MLLGDFNMILRAAEKSNNNLNRTMMNRFRQFVDDQELKEMYMHGQKFTWSNERTVPTLTKIDRVLISVDWELENPSYLLQALSTRVSDHAPLHLSTSANFCPKKRFRFELFWNRMEGFEDAVREAWVCDASIVDPYKRLDALLRNTANHLQAWGQRKLVNVKTLMRVATWVIHKLDVAQENGILQREEVWLRRTLKHSLLGLAALERTIDRQRSRLKWIKEGDANTKLFQAVANGRRTKNYIPYIKHGKEIITDQERMVDTFTEVYKQLMGTAHAREHTLDLQFLQMEPKELSSLEEIITEEEVWQVIKEMAPDRAPGPNGFIGAVYQ
ncbi:uncharacterized protein [Aegilops tauschii subsp. strangulata]|uniref:uncharacterized protein n=1 Tax=Aegilops tauschii subsp. strangulata TaxID=200361 RepID=UPI003CC85AB8